MAQEVVATFPGPLSSFSINLQLDNSTKSFIRAVGISSQTAKFPAIWDSFGSPSGPVSVISTNGLDTQVVFLRFSGFAPGEKINFNGIDPDFVGDSSSGVHVGDLAGTRIVVVLPDLTARFGEFEATDSGELRAVVTI